MKRCPVSVPGPGSRAGGFTLIEVLVYGAVLLIVSGIAVSTFLRTLDHVRDVRRVSDDITRALDAGERWRADVRAATGVPRLVEDSGAVALHLPRPGGDVVYFFDGQRMMRRTSDTAPWHPVLTGLRSSRFVADARERVTGWRWDVELQTRSPNPRLRPVFTFLAVPMKGGPR